MIRAEPGIVDEVRDVVGEVADGVQGVHPVRHHRGLDVGARRGVARLRKRVRLHHVADRAPGREDGVHHAGHHRDDGLEGVPDVVKAETRCVAHGSVLKQFPVELRVLAVAVQIHLHGLWAAHRACGLRRGGVCVRESLRGLGHRCASHIRVREGVRGLLGGQRGTRDVAVGQGVRRGGNCSRGRRGAVGGQRGASGGSGKRRERTCRS